MSEPLNPETVARAFHETYERLASGHAYETRPESAVEWEQVPENNRALMVETASVALAPFLLAAKAEGVQEEHDRMIYAVSAINPTDKPGEIVKVETLIAIGEAEKPPDLDAVGERDRIRAILANYEQIATDAHEHSEGNDRLQWGAAVRAFHKMREAIDQ